MQTNILSQHPCRNEEGKLTTSKSLATPGDIKKKQPEPTTQSKTWMNQGELHMANSRWAAGFPSNPSSWNSDMQWNIQSYPHLLILIYISICICSTADESWLQRTQVRYHLKYCNTYNYKCQTHFLKELSYKPKVTTKITPGVRTLISKENILSCKRQQHKPHKSLLSNLVRAQDKVSHTELTNYTDWWIPMSKPDTKILEKSVNSPCLHPFVESPFTP
jgi:hypothetical protein